MPKDKKSKINDIKKLRQILDSPYDPKISAFKDNKNLESIRQRLSGESSKTDMKYASTDVLSKKYGSLEPRVTIYQKEEKAVPPEIKKLEPDERIEDVKDGFPEEDLLDDVDLYEIEKVDITEPDFLEVKPKETTKKQEEIPKEAEVFLPIPEPAKKEKAKDMEVADEELPEWEPVEETKPEETVDEQEGKISEEFPEFEKIDEKVEPQPPNTEIEKEILTREPVSEESVKEKIVELPEEPQKERKAVRTTGEKEQQKVRILSFLKERKREKKKREKESLEGLETKRSKKFDSEMVVGGKENEENILKKLESEGEKKKVKGITADVEEEVPTWEPVEETKPEETVDEQEGKISEEFPEFEKIDEKVEPQPPNTETEKEIPTWEPVSEENVKEEIVELPEEPKEDKPFDKDREKISKEKERKAKIAEKENEVELKRQEKEQRVSGREEQRLKKIKEKKALIAARKKEREAKKAEKEKKRKLREKQKEEQRLKKIKEKKALIAAREKERVARIAEMEKRAELKKQEKEQRAKKKETAKQETVSPVKSISEIEELTEWESYDVEEEIPEIEHHAAKPYKYGGYTLYEKEIKTSAGKKRTIHFFSKKKPDIGEAVQLPKGYGVKINKRTKLPYLKKKK